MCSAGPFPVLRTLRAVLGASRRTPATRCTRRACWYSPEIRSARNRRVRACPEIHERRAILGARHPPIRPVLGSDQASKGRRGRCVEMARCRSRRCPAFPARNQTLGGFYRFALVDRKRWRGIVDERGNRLAPGSGGSGRRRFSRRARRAPPRRPATGRGRSAPDGRAYRREVQRQPPAVPAPVPTR